jgi:flavin-dependent dehydrogenase
MIVGSGIVGCYLGRILGKQEIWEKNRSIIEKPCSSLLSKTGLATLDIYYDDCVLNEIRGAEFFSDSQKFKIEKKVSQALVLDRLKLQKELVKEAEDKGCKIKYGKTWSGQKDDFIIGTDGALSAVAKSMGVRHKYILAYQVKAQLKKKIDSDFVQLYFGDFAPGFFGWLIPFDERNVEIGLGVSRGNPKQNFDAFSKRFQIKRIKAIQSALIPVFDPEQKTVYGNKALVGDSAGQVKATTGGGIIFGCKCAEILAEAIDKRDLAYYEKDWRTSYGRDLKMHLKLRRFLDKVNYDELFSKIVDNGVDELIEEYGDMDHPRGLVKQLLMKPGLWSYLPKFLFV